MLKLDGDILYIELPQGQTQDALIQQMLEELKDLEQMLYGKVLKINGRITTGMALALGHRLAHICREVHIFDPKENSYVKAVWH